MAKQLRPDTFQLTLPSGEKVRCWRRQAAEIYLDVKATGSVALMLDHASGVYERLPPGTAMPPDTRHVG